MNTLATLLLSLLPQTAIPTVHTEVIELNHVMQHQGDGEYESRLDQIILWGPHPNKPGLHVREWYVARNLVIESNVRQPFVILNDRVIRASVLCESWTGTDIEREDLEHVKCEERVLAK